jgi:hypothetical protein
MQYLFQSFNFRGATAKPYRDLLYGVGTEEISHVELIATTIARLTDGSPRYKGSAAEPVDEAGKGGATPLSDALSMGNIHHYLVGAQGALPVDAAGNPWSGSYVYNSGNLVLDLLYNLMLESTGRLQKCRIYEMTENKTARSTVAYLIVRDQAHENAYADPEDRRRAVPGGQDPARPGAAPQAVHLQPRQPLRSRQDLPRRRSGGIEWRDADDRADARRVPDGHSGGAAGGVRTRAEHRVARTRAGHRRARACSG